MFHIRFTRPNIMDESRIVLAWILNDSLVSAFVRENLLSNNGDNRLSHNAHKLKLIYNRYIYKTAISSMFILLSSQSQYVRARFSRQMAVIRATCL